MAKINRENPHISGIGEHGFISVDIYRFHWWRHREKIKGTCHPTYILNNTRDKKKDFWWRFIVSEFIVAIKIKKTDFYQIHIITNRMFSDTHLDFLMYRGVPDYR